MLRGGSWNNNPDHVRASVRNNNHPDNRNNAIGFRVLCSSHIKICSAAGIASRLWLAGRGRRWVDGAGESRPHVAPSHRAHSKTGCRLDSLPRRPPFTACYRVDCLIHPPSSLPISATSALTCAYCPSFSQCHCYGQYAPVPYWSFAAPHLTLP